MSYKPACAPASQGYNNLGNKEHKFESVQVSVQRKGRRQEREVGNSLIDLIFQKKNDSLKESQSSCLRGEC